MEQIYIAIIKQTKEIQPRGQCYHTITEINNKDSSSGSKTVKKLHKIKLSKVFMLAVGMKCKHITIKELKD